MVNMEKFHEKYGNIIDTLSGLKMDLEEYVKEVDELLDDVHEEWETVGKKIKELEESDVIDEEEYDSLCSKTFEYSDNSKHLEDTVNAMKDIIKVLSHYA